MPGVELADRQCRTADEVAEFVSSGCDALLTFRVPNDIATRARGLKWIQLLSAGADHVLGGPLKGIAIPITTASGIHATPIAEYTLASMLAYAHRIHLAIRAQTRREWMRSGAFMGSVDEIRGRTLGIVGYGSIGRETARLAAAFGMKVLALKRNPADRVDPGWSPAGLGDPDGKIPARFFGPDDREAILRESDYVSVTLPLTDHTRKFIGEREFAAMKPGAYLVNIGRGEVIDERAMAAALSLGQDRRRRPRRLRARTIGIQQPAVGPRKRHPDAAHLRRQSRLHGQGLRTVRGKPETLRRQPPTAERGRSQPRLLI